MVGGDDKDINGLTIGTLDAAMKFYKGGGEPNHELGSKARGLVATIDESIDRDWIYLSPKAMETLKAKDGDIVYMSDSRWWLGGLRSHHVKAKSNSSLANSEIAMSTETYKEAYLLDGKPLVAEKII